MSIGVKVTIVSCDKERQEILNSLLEGHTIYKVWDLDVTTLTSVIADDGLACDEEEFKQVIEGIEELVNLLNALSDVKGSAYKITTKEVI